MMTSWLDQLQQRNRFVIAVIYKYVDDQGGYLAALITYYAFVSLFPLLFPRWMPSRWFARLGAGTRYDAATSRRSRRRSSRSCTKWRIQKIGAPAQSGLAADPPSDPQAR